MKNMMMCFTFKDLLISVNFSGALTRSPGSGTGAGLAKRLLNFLFCFQRFLICSIRLAVDFRKKLKGKKTFTVSTTQHANIFGLYPQKKINTISGYGLHRYTEIGERFLQMWVYRWKKHFGASLEFSNETLYFDFHFTNWALLDRRKDIPIWMQSSKE